MYEIIAIFYDENNNYKYTTIIAYEYDIEKANQLVSILKTYYKEYRPHSKTTVGYRKLV